jgi:BMFP domain-containing protein YqiC
MTLTMQTSDIIKKIANEIVEELPGTIKHITCTREDAERRIAETLEKILTRLIFASGNPED